MKKIKKFFKKNFGKKHIISLLEFGEVDASNYMFAHDIINLASHNKGFDDLALSLLDDFNSFKSSPQQRVKNIVEFKNKNFPDIILFYDYSCLDKKNSKYNLMFCLKAQHYCIKELTALKLAA